MNIEESMMRQALALAESTVALASPNPQVGCVLARENIFLAEGAHLYDQRDHAEIVALKQAASLGIDVRGATAYVTLEPCAHHGRTGPCADALILAGISRCLIATVDPNPLVAGQGIARLRAAGIQVEVGLCQTEARTLNNAFATSITLQRPFVTLKSALSVDGYLAPPPAIRTDAVPFWLTGIAARAEVQQLRHAADAILVGIGTILADDPLLTDRTGLPRRRPLLRVVLDTHLNTPVSAKLVQNAHQDLWIFCGPDATPDRRAALESAGAHIVSLSTLDSKLSTHRPGLSLSLPEILAHLHAAQIQSILLEAGSQINGAFLAQNLVDRAILYFAETELGPGSIPFAANHPGPFELESKMLSVTKTMVGADVRVEGLLQDPWPNLAGFS